MSYVTNMFSIMIRIYIKYLNEPLEKHSVNFESVNPEFIKLIYKVVSVDYFKYTLYY